MVINLSICYYKLMGCITVKNAYCNFIKVCHLNIFFFFYPKNILLWTKNYLFWEKTVLNTETNFLIWAIVLYRTSSCRVFSNIFGLLQKHNSSMTCQELKLIKMGQGRYNAYNLLYINKIYWNTNKSSTVSVCT